MSQAGAWTGLQFQGCGDAQGFDSSSPAPIARCFTLFRTTKKHLRLRAMSVLPEIAIIKPAIAQLAEHLTVDTLQ